MKTILIAGLGNPGKEYEKTRHSAGFLFVDYFLEKYRDEFGFSDWEFGKKLNAEISVGKIKGKTEKNKKLNFLTCPKCFDSSQGKCDKSTESLIHKQPGKIVAFQSRRATGKLFNFSNSGGAAKIILMKPQTFMNLSGEAVAAAVKYYKLKLEDIFVAHDEIDLPLGNYKTSKNSSSAGHRGVQNIIDMLGTKDFTRLRIGVDNRPASAKASARQARIPTEKYVLGKFTAAEMKKASEIISEASMELMKKINGFNGI